MSHINFDANATLELHPVLRGMSLNLDEMLNPSSIHTPGQRARMCLEKTREAILHLLELNSDYRVIFTSGATEANNLAINLGKNIISSVFEHVSVLEPLKQKNSLLLEKLNREELDKFDQEIDLSTFMQANNETGEIYNLDFLDGYKFLKHTDAVQALGKFKTNYKKYDLISISGHKLGALAGVGALIVKKSIRLNPLILGGSQELFNRAGTENLFGIYTLGLVCEDLISAQDAQFKKLADYKKIVLEQINNLPIKILKLESQLPNTIHLTIDGIVADDLVVACDLEGLCISAGSACASGKPNPSHVLLSMGYSEAQAKSSVRVSISPFLTLEQVENGGRILKKTIEGFLELSSKKDKI